MGAHSHLSIAVYSAPPRHANPMLVSPNHSRYALIDKCVIDVQRCGPLDAFILCNHCIDD